MSVAADQIAALSTTRDRVSAGISREADRLAQLLDEEINGLGVSRTPGFGPIAEDIQAALRALRDGGTSFRGQSIRRSSQLGIVRNHLARARDASNVGNETAFFENVSSARTILSALAGQNSARIDLSYDFSSSSEPSVRTVASRLNNLRNSGFGTGERIVLPTYTPISRPVAVL